MIYYFSGTGNSKWVAEQLAALTGEGTEEITPSLTVGHGDVACLVFPVYAWGLPRIVARFIDRNPPLRQSAYVCAVMTCGDDMGYADRILADRMGGRLDACFSVRMPNTYVCLPGFDIDPPEVARRKVSETQTALPAIAKAITERERKTDVCRGRMPWTKTHILRPLFDCFLVTDHHFHADENRCVQCGKCVKNCPMADIEFHPRSRTATIAQRAGWPHWLGGDCTGCLRCYHSCPVNAVQYGALTKNKGQKSNDFD